MKAIIRRTWIKRTLAATIASLLCFTFAWADHKPGHNPGGGDGSGGAGSNGGGVIYFTYQGDLYTMNDDGSGMAPVAGFPAGFGTWVEPSHQLHAGKRWFSQTREIVDEFYPDFHPDGTIKDFAYRKVFVALSDAGDVVELNIAPDLEPLESPKWDIGDDCLSWSGRQWDIDPTSPTYGEVLEGGLYVTELAFDAAGNVTGIAGPSLLLVEFPLVPSNAYRQSSDFTPGPDMYSHDWAPDGMRFVFDAVSAEELWIADAATGGFQLLFADPLSDYVGAARWSPAGDRLMFQYDPDIGHTRVMLINPDSSGEHMLVRSSPNWTRTMGVWSPTGSHLLYQHWDHFFDDSYIVRATAEGSGKKRMTDKSLGEGYSTPRAIGWRD